ncbi:MAG: MFS transporter [Faecalibacterium sp.]|nr:MFS transporter [Ruminococcus sp.]MCM1391384.1 MFS transporter [Ruminococcus sp.]MCM1484594.1 MFS transporter [Faecalibacterium sp.]
MANKTNGLVGMAKGLVDNIRTFWDRPSLGNDMSWKEIFSFSGGGIGVYFIVSVYTNILVQNTNNIILANTLGFSPSQVYLVFIISVIAGFPLAFLRSHLIDNARSKKGRFRPFLIKMGIPSVILGIAYLWFPYEHVSKNTALAVVMLFNIAFQFFYNFFKESYEGLIFVLSSNTYERSRVTSIQAVVYSLAPSIVQFIVPVLSKWISGGHMNDIKLYRYLYPPFLIFGFIVSLIVYANVREKIVQAKTHVPQIKLLDSLKMVLKNKYIWIISLAGWIGFLEACNANILYWLFEYGHACSSTMYGFVNLIYGNASFWGMILAPIFIRKFGKQKVIITINLLNIVFLAIMYPLVQSIWLVLIVMYLNAAFSAFAHILNPSINADIRDYQHYVTGERIDGVFSIITYLGTVIGMITSAVMPVIYKAIGIFEGNGFENPYDILDVNNGATAASGQPVLYHALQVLLLFSVGGAILNVIPYFFYNLTENKHRGIVKVLKIRALFEDYGNKVYKDRELVDAIDLIEESKVASTMQPIAIDKNLVKNAKKTKDKAKVAEAKEQLKKDTEINAMIEDAKLILDEISKYDTELGHKKLAFAKKIYAEGYEGLKYYDKSAHKKAKKYLPKKTAEDKEFRKFELEYLSNKKRSAKLIAKYYPNGVGEFDMESLISLYDKINSAEENIADLYAEYDKIAKTNKAEAKAIKAKISELKAQIKELNKQLEVVNKKYVIHNRVVKPFTDAEKIVTQDINYHRYDEILAQYEDAKVKAEEAERLAALEEERKREEEAAYDKKVKEEKKLAKASKKSNK